MAYIRKKPKIGKTRSEQEENLRKEGMRSLTDEQLDKCKHLEKKYGKGFWFPDAIDRVK